MLLLLAIFLNHLGAPAAEDNRTIKLTMNLDLKDCTWTRKPGKESMPAYPTFASDHVPGCFKHCYDTFTIYEDVWDEINYADTGRPSPNGKGDLFKRCEVPGEPKASYLCGNRGFSCAITGDKDGDDKDKDGKNPRLKAFPQSCVANSWGAANKVGAGSVPNGKATLAIYAYSNYESRFESMKYEGIAKGSRRIIAYQVHFEDVDDAYDGMCQGIAELDPESPIVFDMWSTIGFREYESATAPLPLPGVQQGIWPTPPFFPSPRYSSATAKLGLDLKKDCTWTRKPGKESMPAYPTFESGHVPGCFKHSYDTLEIFRFMQETPAYSYTGRAENKGFNKMCDVPGEPRAAYLPGPTLFRCAHWDEKHSSLNDAFPQSCVASGWGAKNKVGAGTVPNGKATLAIYAYGNYETEGSVKGSRRTIAYQVHFEDVDDAYDGMCQGTLELEPGSVVFGVHAGEGLTVEDAVAPLALPGVQQGIWPTVPFQPTPKEDKSEHEYNKAAAKMNLDYKKDCTWTKKPGKESMPAYPTFASDHVPGCFLHCFDTFEINVNVWAEVQYVDTGKTEPGKDWMVKSCDFPSLTTPRSYACGNNRFICAIGGDKDEEDQDEGDKLKQPNPRMAAFPQSCVAESWYLANHQRYVSVPKGKASLALYAYSNYETEGSVKGSRRTITYQVRFEDVDDAYDGMCQGTLELEPGESAFGVHAGEGLTVEDAVAPLPLPVLQQGVWPTPPFQPTPTDKPKTPPKKIDDKENKDKNGEGSKVTPKTIDNKGKDGSKVAPATIDDKGKGKNGDGSKVAPKTIDDKGKDKSGVEGSGVPWVPIIAGVGLLSACSAFFIRRSRRVAQFADTA